jgi:hypothetical protein
VVSIAQLLPFGGVACLITETSSSDNRFRLLPERKGRIVETKLRYRAQMQRWRRIPRSSGYLNDAQVARKRATEQWYGSQGPASAICRIDPATGEVIEVIPPRPDRFSDSRVSLPFP